MSENKKKPWFKGDLGRDFSKRQTVDNILPLIALTATNPHHQEALQGSCHWFTSQVLRQHLPLGNIVDSDEIVLLGSGNTVFHSIITRGNDQILADRASTKRKCTIDLEAGKYCSEHYEETNPGIAKDVSILKRITIADFKRDYMDQITISQQNEPEEPIDPAL